MPNEITTNTTFQQKMFERIRDQLGDLISDNELKALINATIQKAFFEPRKVASNYGYRDHVELEAIWTELVRAELSTRVKIVVQEWVSQNPDLFAKAVDAAIAKGFYELVKQHMEERISIPLNNFSQELKNRGIEL